MVNSDTARPLDKTFFSCRILTTDWSELLGCHLDGQATRYEDHDITLQISFIDSDTRDRGGERAGRAVRESSSDRGCRATRSSWRFGMVLCMWRQTSK